MIKKYYFTFGTDEHFPYQRGWVEVHAHSLEQAKEVFRIYFPDRKKGIVNCSFIYNEFQWLTTIMATGLLKDEYCHAKLGLIEERK